MAAALPQKKKPSLLSHVKWEHCAAGVSGGVLSTLVLHPLDLIKVRFQGKFLSWSSALRVVLPFPVNSRRVLGPRPTKSRQRVKSYK